MEFKEKFNDDLKYTWDKKKINWVKMVFLIIFSSRFRWHLRETIFYSLNTHELIRGQGASDVLLFESNSRTNGIFHTEN